MLYVWSFSTCDSIRIYPLYHLGFTFCCRLDRITFPVTTPNYPCGVLWPIKLWRPLANHVVASFGQSHYFRKFPPIISLPCFRAFLFFRISSGNFPAKGFKVFLIGSTLNPLEGKFSEDTRKKGKGAKTGASHDWRSFSLSQYDWLKGSHMTKVVWLLIETDYSYCEFVAPKLMLPIISKETRGPWTNHKVPGPLLSHLHIVMLYIVTQWGSRQGLFLLLLRVMAYSTVSDLFFLCE